MKKIQADKAFKIDSQIKNLRRGAVKNFWEMIHWLWRAREYKIWVILDCESWAAYLAQPEIDLAKPTVDNYIWAYQNIATRLTSLKSEKLIQSEPVKLNFGSERAKLITPRLDEENVEELVAKAESLSYSDLKKELSVVQEEDEMTIRYVIAFLLVIKDDKNYVVAKRIPPIKSLNQYFFQEVAREVLTLEDGVPDDWVRLELPMAIIELTEFISRGKQIAKQAKDEIEEAINLKLKLLAETWRAEVIKCSLGGLQSQ